MQNEFDGHSSLEAQRDIEEPGRRNEEEQDPGPAAGPAETGREDVPVSGEEEPDLPQESGTGQDPELERERPGQPPDEDTEQEPGAFFSEEDEGAAQPEILIDIEEEEKKAELAERKARLDKERLDKSRRLQQYYQDQYIREQYYREQDQRPTVHSIDGLTVYEDESAVSGIAGHAYAGKKTNTADTALTRVAEGKPRSYGREKSLAAGIEEPEGGAPEPAAARPKPSAEKKLSLKKVSGENTTGRNALWGAQPAEETSEKASGKHRAGYGPADRYVPIETGTKGPGPEGALSFPSRGILGPDEQAAGIEPSPAGAEDLSGSSGKPEPVTARGIRRSLMPVSRVLRPGKQGEPDKEAGEDPVNLRTGRYTSGSGSTKKSTGVKADGRRPHNAGALEEFAEKASEEISKRMEEEAVKTTVMQGGFSSQMPGRQGSFPFFSKLKTAVKALAKKAAVGTLAGVLTVTAAAGGYNAVNGGTSSWYPVQAHVTTDGSDTGTSLTQDVLTKMFTRLGAYGITTSYDTSSAAGPLTIHIPGYESGSTDVRWGDSQILITAGGSCLLIDGGCGILSDMTLEYLAQKGVSQLTAIITHWHGDHYTGLARILNDGAIHVDAVYCPPPDEIWAFDAAEAFAGGKICDAVEDQGGKVVHPAGDQTTKINLSGISMEIWRESAQWGRDSDTSVNDGSMQIYFSELYYLTTGDIVYSLPRYLETMEGRTIKFFEVPHHGNGSRLAMPLMRDYGAEACWYNNVEPGGDMDNSFFPLGARAARSAGYEVFKTLGDIDITAGGGMVVISGQGKTYTYSCPYNPGGEGAGNRDLVSYAEQWVGKIPYKSSVTGNDPDNERFEPLAAGRGSDCSWFVFHCLEHCGILDEFVHSYEWGTEPEKYPGGTNIGTDLSMARPGDILCYAYGSGKRGNRVSGNSHVGIYTGDGKQIECAAGYGVTKSDVDKDNLIEIVRFGSAGISASYASYNGGESKSRHGFSALTEAIVEQHMNDFDYYTFDSFMASRGGAGSYIRSLGGVFAKWYGRDAKVQTAGEFQEIAEYVMGIYTIWGPDYHGGGGKHRFNGDYGSGDENGRFYPGGDNERWWIVSPIEEEFINNKERVMTDCGCGIYHIMQKAGLMDEYAGMGTISDAESYLTSHNCYAQGGKIITKREDLQVGDLVQMIKAEDHKWHHVSVVGEIRADGGIILYDTGNRYVNTSNYKKEFITDSSGIHGAYEGYESWFGVRVRQISQTATNGMAVQSLKEIRIASVTVDGEPVDKSGFSYENLRDFSRSGKGTSTVIAKFRFEDENGDEIRTASAAGNISPVSHAGASAVSGEEIMIPEGLGSVHTYMGWQRITSTTSNQYRLRQEAGENYDGEGFAIIDGRYVIACTTTFGNVGDYIDFYKEDGLVLHCIMGEAKNQSNAGCNEWGHNGGRNVIEFVVDENSWYSGGKGSHANPGTPSCHPEWASDLVKAVNIGPRAGGPSTTQTAFTQGQYDMQCMELAKQILSMSAAGSYYKNPVNLFDYDWYCFDLIDFAVCDYHGADVEYRTAGDVYVCTATVTVCCSLLELEKGDKNFKSWETGLRHGDLIPLSYMGLSKIDFEDIFNVDLTIPQKLSQVVFSGVEQEVYSFFLSKGLGAAQIAGIMGNIRVESGFDPSAQNKNGASGLFQWMDGRFQKLKEYASSKGKEWTDVQAQLEYAWTEISGDEGWNGHTAQKRQFMETSSAFQAAVLFCSCWERGGDGAEAAERGRYAEEYYSKIMSAGQGSAIDYVRWAVSIANDDSHGYSQYHRGGDPDYDCASLVFYALKNTGYDVGSSPFTTHTMEGVLSRCGFRKIPISSSSEMMPGDILWKQNHTEIYIGDGKTVGAHCDENGGIAGTNRGDQTGHEIDVGDVGSWYYVFRKG